MNAYVQPIAQHARHPERLMLRGEDDRYYVWQGDDPTAEPEEIEPATAIWLLTRSALVCLAEPRVWVHVADLPLAPTPACGGQP